MIILNIYYLDDIFVASSNVTDLLPTDLQEINIEMHNDTQLSTSRNAGLIRNQLKQNLRSTPDRDTPNAQSGAITVDLKKMANVRDSGFLDDEDGLSGRDSELTTSRKTPSRPSNNNNKQYETVSEDAPTPNDLMGRKLKSKKIYFDIKIEEKNLFKEPSFKPTSVLSVEQQRERERQRLRDEEERRKKILMRKDHQQAGQIQSVPKFEPLSVDINNDESRPNKSKTPTTGTGTFSPHFPLINGGTSKILNKPLSITPIPRTNYDENDPNNNEAGAAAALVPTPVPRKHVIKKRSSVLVR